MDIETVLKSSDVGTKIYVDNASQPYTVVAKNDSFLIAIKRNFSTKSLAFDIKKNECGFFSEFNMSVNFDDVEEVNKLLQDLTEYKINIIKNRKKITTSTVKKIKVGTEVIYG